MWNTLGVGASPVLASTDDPPSFRREESSARDKRVSVSEGEARGREEGAQEDRDEAGEERGEGARRRRGGGNTGGNRTKETGKKNAKDQ